MTDLMVWFLLGAAIVLAGMVVGAGIVIAVLCAAAPKRGG